MREMQIDKLCLNICVGESVIDSLEPPRFWNNLPVKPQFSPRPVTLSVPLVSDVTKNLVPLHCSWPKSRRNSRPWSQGQGIRIEEGQLFQDRCFRLRFSRTYRFGNQIRPRHRYLWYGLLCRYEASRFLHLATSSTTSKDWPSTSTH